MFGGKTIVTFAQQHDIIEGVFKEGESAILFITLRKKTSLVLKGFSIRGTLTIRVATAHFITLVVGFEPDLA